MAIRKSYKPGSRNANFRNDRDEGKISENRLAWLRTAVGQAVIMFYDKKEDVEDEDPNDNVELFARLGPSVRLFFPRPNSRTVVLDITSLTLDELIKMRELFSLLFDLAEPSVRLRDKVAQDAFNKGDDSYNRSFRPVGQVVVRTRPLGADHPSLQKRLEDFTNRVGGRLSDNGGVRISSTELAPVQSEEGSTQDNGETADKS